MGLLTVPRLWLGCTKCESLATGTGTLVAAACLHLPTHTHPPNITSTDSEALRLQVLALMLPATILTNPTAAAGMHDLNIACTAQVAEGMQILAQLQNLRWTQAYADAAATWLGGLPTIPKGQQVSGVPAVDGESAAAVAHALQEANCHWPGTLMDKLLRKWEREVHNWGRMLEGGKSSLKVGKSGAYMGTACQWIKLQTTFGQGH
eukprot:1158512-Pelagomonas_calceolata.AAC.8